MHEYICHWCFMVKWAYYYVQTFIFINRNWLTANFQAILQFNTYRLRFFSTKSLGYNLYFYLKLTLTLCVSLESTDELTNLYTHTDTVNYKSLANTNRHTHTYTQNIDQESNCDSFHIKLGWRNDYSRFTMTMHVNLLTVYASDYYRNIITFI